LVEDAEDAIVLTPGVTLCSEMIEDTEDTTELTVDAKSDEATE